MENKMMLHFESASLSNIEDLNASFATGRLKVMYTGENKNGMDISQDVTEAALPSIKNIPIVAHYNIEANEIGSHDMELVKDDNGLRLRNLTEPCGVVPESAEAYFSEEADESGNMHNYLVIDPVILWKRQEVFRHIKDDLDGQVDHSMEINILAYHKDKDSRLVKVDEFAFEALCLLESAQPCFEGSRLELFDIGVFQSRMTQMMDELREVFSTINTPKQEVDIDSNNTEGGRVLDEKLALLEEYGFEADKLGFSLDDFSVEELRGKFDAMKADEEAADQEDDTTAKFELASNLRKFISEALQEKQVMKPWGMECMYCFEDYDQESGMVYAESLQDWNIYGFPFTMSGDKPVIDFDAGKRMKRTFVEFDGGEDQPGAMAQVFENAEAKFREMDEAHKEAFEKLRSENESISAEFEALKEATADIEELRAFKASADEDEQREARENILADFEDLSGNEAFEELRKNCMDYDPETLEEKCFAIRGRTGMQAKFSAKEKSPRIKVVRDEKAEKEPYGGLFQEYGPAE